MLRVVADTNVLVSAVVADDPDDDRVLEAAVEGKARFVVTGDRHLLDLRRYAGIPFVTVAAFLVQHPQ